MAHIPASAVGFLQENLKELIEHHSDLIGAVRDKVKELYEHLEMIKSFIKVYAEKHDKNRFLESLISEIKSEIYEAEDAVDTYIVGAYLRKSRSSISRALHAIEDASELRSVAKKIEKVTERMQVIYKDVVPSETATVRHDPDSNTKHLQLRTWEKIATVKKDSLVGLKDVSREVIAAVTGQTVHLQVISIIGMLGLGKTTLARNVFNHQEVVREFSLRVFVPVSQRFNKRKVLFGILKSLGHVTEEMETMSEEDLVEKLRQRLLNQKYLIVLDDVWEREIWDHLKDAFPDNNNRSRVILTSRDQSIALYAGSKPYYLQFLPQEESRKLLRQNVFDKNSIPSDLMECESSILQRCGGLPTAILVIAGILRNHPDSIDWWKQVSEGVADLIPGDTSPLMNVIKLSYDQLPDHLKLCYLYMGVFPEDFDIPVWKLMQLWIAEGFVERHQYSSSSLLEDVAENYLMELVDKNLVMVGSRRWDGSIKTCRIHDTLLYFCKQEAQKDNLFQDVRNSSPSVCTYLDRCRRICVNDSVTDFMASKPSSKCLRSFLCISGEQISLPVEYVSIIPRAFKLLRVLEIRSIYLTRFPADLFQLILLRYIAFSGHFKVVPTKMSALWNLRTLIIETSSPTLDILANIWKMTHLRHLHTNASASLQKSEDEPSRNPNLQTLSTISPKSCTKEVFDRTPKLKKLGIRGKLADLFDASDGSSLFDNLSILKDLENLKLLNSDRSIPLQELPPTSIFPRKLRELTLLNTLLDWKHMSILGKLEMLEALKLKDCAFQGERWQTEDGGFPNLKALSIGHTDLKVWEASADHFPKLITLSLRHCTQLEALPSDFADMPTLQEIHLEYTSSNLVASARELQQYMGSDCKLIVYPPDNDLHEIPASSIEGLSGKDVADDPLCQVKD